MRGGGTRFTIWQWLHGCFEILRLERIRDLWDDGRITGFANRTDVDDFLKNHAKPNSLMLRFSDSTCGGLSISMRKRALKFKYHSRYCWLRF